eukprot:2716058-Prymnesium_polylepis.1
MTCGARSSLNVTPPPRARLELEHIERSSSSGDPLSALRMNSASRCCCSGGMTGLVNSARSTSPGPCR